MVVNTVFAVWLRFRFWFWLWLRLRFWFWFWFWLRFWLWLRLRLRFWLRLRLRFRLWFWTWDRFDWIAVVRWANRNTFVVRSFCRWAESRNSRNQTGYRVNY